MLPEGHCRGKKTAKKEKQNNETKGGGVERKRENENEYELVSQA